MTMAAAPFRGTAEGMLPAEAKRVTGKGAHLGCSQGDRDTCSLFVSPGEASEKQVNKVSDFCMVPE